MQRPGYPLSLRLSESLAFLDFSFKTNGTSSPVGNVSLATLSAATNTFRGEGVITVARTGTGTFLVTMDAGYVFRERIWIDASLEDDAATGAWATVGQFANEGNNIPPTFVITTFAGTTATDFGTGGTGNNLRCGVSACFRTTGVGK